MDGRPLTSTCESQCETSRAGDLLAETMRTKRPAPCPRKENLPVLGVTLQRLLGNVTSRVGAGDLTGRPGNNHDDADDI